MTTTPNPPGRPALRRRASTHATALARMRAGLDLPADDPAVALLDTWAYVADVVAFYTERIAQEGYLRTATQRGSVRELARMLGYELRPGVAAQSDLVFFAQDGPGTPETVLVPRGTPAQSVPKAAPIGAPPGPAELPQTFETGADLEVRAAWNVLPAVAGTPQVLGFGRDHVWLRGDPGTLAVGDRVLVVGDERIAYGKGKSTDRDDDERWDFRTVTEVRAADGWVRLALDRPIGFRRERTLVAKQNVLVYAFGTRARLFGWSAPDPNLLVTEGRVPAGIESDGKNGWRWADFGLTGQAIEVDGEHPEILAGSWVVLEQLGRTEVYRVAKATPDGAQRYALSGPFTFLTLDIKDLLATFGRRRATVHCGTGRPLPSAEEPATEPVTGRTVAVVASDPPLPAGRRIMLRGADADTGEPATEVATVAACQAAPGGTMTITLVAALTHRFRPAGLEVLGNVVPASHGESVAQVLGSGDGRTAFATFRPRRGPLTYVRADTPDGARPELTVRVDGVAWTPVADLAGAGPADRVYAVRHDEDGSARIVLGDGEHGARPATGAENVTAAYRVGIGAAGAVDAGQISLLPRRPLGVREVLNPAASTDWAPAEDLATARVTAPRQVRTLGRAVSVADHEDFARGYAGIGPARADLVWDGRVNRVVLSVRGTAAAEPGAGLLADLERTLVGARDPGGPLDVRAGSATTFGIRVAVAHDPAYERPAVLAAVTAALADAYGPERAAFAAPIVSAAVLVVVRGTPGVLACTMPVLRPADGKPTEIIAPLPAHWDGGVVPAELAVLDTVDLEPMSP